MCTPVQIIGGLLSAVSAQQKARKEKAYRQRVDMENRLAFLRSQQAREAERQRQQALENESDAYWRNAAAAARRERIEGQAADVAEDFTQQVEQAPAVFGEATRLPGQEGASVDVRGAIARSVAEASRDSANRLRNLAEFLSLGQSFGDVALALQEAGSDIDLVGGLRRGSLAASSLEQSIPPKKVDPPDTTGLDFIGGIGGLLAQGGPDLFRGGLFGGPTPGTLAPTMSPRPRPRPATFY